MSKTKLELAGKSFLFVEDLSIKRGQPLEVELLDRTDSFLATIARNIHSGFLRSTISKVEIAEMLKDQDSKDLLKLSIGLEVDPARFQSQEVAEVEVLEVVAEEVQEEVLEESKGELSASDDKLKELLEGTNKSVVSALKELEGKLSEEELESLLKLEESGKNRATIKKTIKGL